jgi:phosphoglycerol transferase
LAQRSIEGSVITNTRSGYPFGSDLYDYPNSDSGNLLLYKILGYFTHPVYSTVDLYLLLSFPTAFVSAFIVFRSFSIRKVYSAMAALLFTFAPFHFARLFYGHYFYTWYFTIPLFFYFGWNLFTRGKVFAGPMGLAAFVGILCVAGVLGSFGVYYAFFGAIVLVVCGAAASFKTSSFLPIVNAAAFCALILASVAINLAPYIAYRETHSINHEVAERSPIATEVYALKIMHLILPQPDHRISALGAYTRWYDTTFPLSNTNSSLGIVGVVGFVAILLAAGAAMIGKPVRPKLGFTALVVISLLLVSTVGGFNVLFATLVTPLIRGWDRIAIFISFGSMLAFTLLVDGLKSINMSRWASCFAATLVAVVGFLDQTPASYSAITAAAAGKASIDRSFVQQIEASLPAGAAVYQLPYFAFPESGPVEQLGPYELASGFLNSTALHWSYGGMQGRDGDLFYRALAREPAEKQLEVIERLGFAGVYIDRRGFADHGATIIADFTRLLGVGPMLERSDGSVAFFRIPHHAEQPPKGLSSADLMSRADFFADRFGVRSNATLAEGIDFSSSAKMPGFVVDVSGMSQAEAGGRWSDANVAKSVVISFSRPLPNRFTLRLTGTPFGPNTGKKLLIRIGRVEKQIDMPGPFDAHVPVDLNGQNVSAIEFVPPSPTSPEELHIGPDPRRLGVAFRTLKVE